MQNLDRPFPSWNNLNAERSCDFLSTNMESTWDEFYFKRSFMGVIEKFIETVEVMESTVLIPSRLMGLSLAEILPKPNCDSYLQENMEMRVFFDFMKAVKTQIHLGISFVLENEERNSPMQCKLGEATGRINQLILIAKYITIFAQNIAFQAKTLSYSEFENAVRFSKETTLLGALKKFLNEIEEMEKAVLFPCLLKDHGAVGDLPKFFNSSSPVDNLHDVFTMLKLLKNGLLSGANQTELANEKIQQLLSELYQTLRRYTALTSSLTNRYKQEVQCF
jgi:hypothetical protein